MISIRAIRRASPALTLVAALGLAGCSGGIEREGERAGREVKQDVRGMRDFLRERGITIDTRLPER